MPFSAKQAQQGNGPRTYNLQLDRSEIERLLVWLRSDEPPDSLIMIIDGAAHHFRTYAERHQFACGFEACLNASRIEKPGPAELDQTLCLPSS